MRTPDVVIYSYLSASIGSSCAARGRVHAGDQPDADRHRGREEDRRERPALTTHGYRNHAVRTEKWRYIRYADGGEELYDEAADPYEWRNLARDAERAGLKSELAGFFPKLDRPGRTRAKPASN